MPRLTFDDATVQQLLQIGDALVRGGNAEAARAVYRKALETPSPYRKALLNRLGLISKLDASVLPLMDLLAAGERLDAGNAFVGDGLATWLKQQPFHDDPRFIEVAERHCGLLPVRNWQWNLQTALWAVRRSLSVPGDFVELGVFKGHTTMFCADYLDFQDRPKRWFLYDTFEGIPQDQLDPGWAQANQAAYGGTFSYEEVRDRFARFPNIEVIQGRVPDIFASRPPPAAIAFMHIDLNNAAAELAALDALFDQVSPGGAILFDDFAWTSSAVQYKAEKAWFAARGEEILPLPTGQGLYIKP